MQQISHSSAVQAELTAEYCLKEKKKTLIARFAFTEGKISACKAKHLKFKMDR